MQKDKLKSMSKFTCLILCAVAVNLNSVYAESAEVRMILMECAKEYGVRDADMIAVMEAKNTTIIEPCFWGCILKKAGFLNDKGEYDLNTGMTFVEKMTPNDPERAKIKEIATECESVKDKAVNDGEAGCERGALVATCFMEQVEARRKQEHP